MYTLILDSSTKVLYEALIKDDKVISEHYIKGENDHAKNIVYILEQMLKEEGINTSDLNKIVVGIGPGSYTGVRMASTVAKMIGAFMHVDIYKVSSLMLMASGTKGEVLSLIDARRGNSFSGCYNGGVLVDSEAIRNTADYTASHNGASIVTEKEFVVDPFLVIEKAIKHDNPHSLEPNYLQETEAERNLHHEN